ARSGAAASRWLGWKCASTARLCGEEISSTSDAPAAAASSTTYWIVGLSRTGSSSFATALAAGSIRVPRPAAGMTTLLTLIGSMIGSRLVNQRPQDGAADRREGIDQFLVLPAAVIEAADGAAAAGEFGAGAGRARDLDHAQILRRDRHDLSPQVEVFVHHFVQPVPVFLQQRVAAAIGQVAILLPRADHRRVAAS